MLVLSYVLVFLLSIAGIFGLKFLLKKFENKKDLILKVVSVSLFVLMFVRYMMGDVAIAETRGLNMYSPFGDNVFNTMVGLILIWVTYGSILLITLYSFFKIDTVKNVLKFVAVPNMLLNGIFFYVYGVSIIGVNAFVEFVFNKDKSKFKKKLLAAILLLIGIILVKI